MARIPEITVGVTNILQDIYDSEINITISWFWDGGIDIGIGDAINGFKDENNFDTILEAMRWLRQRLVELYPESDFAKKWSNEDAPQ
jgi:hypothetical protein